MARRKAKKATHKYMTIWWDKKGTIHEKRRVKIDWACEDFRKAQGNAVRAVLARLHADQQTTLAEWPR